MSHFHRTGKRALSPALVMQVDEACDRFEAAWKAGQRPQLEGYLSDTPLTPLLSGERGEERSALLRELIVVEVHYRRGNGETPVPAEYQRRFPDHAETIDAVFHEEVALQESGIRGQRMAGLTLDASLLTPDLAGEAVPSSHLPLSSPTSSDLLSDGRPDDPVRVGRYRITAKIGSGSFGVVYQGHDDELRRDVAIKILRRRHISFPNNVDSYLAEARILAGLDHPAIIPVHDVGRTNEGHCYLVTKLAAGNDLRQWLQNARLSVAFAVEIVARVAEALHHAHQRGLVHRDVKPANVLLDADGNPLLTDFGLALREEDFPEGPVFAGTLPYMSPEQARGEGHLVDRRTDVCSLGVVFYELLTGQRPFSAASEAELLEQVKTVEPRPPSHLDDTIPRELDRICLKALSKRVSDRYSTALDLAEDLRH